MENKHAYLIIAHNQFELLEFLLKSLDYKYNDIYLHVDIKAGALNFEKLYKCVECSNLYILKKRLNVKWGDYSQIECEMLLLKNAVIKGYRYYHLLSGVDMPLKSQEEIHRFYNENYGIEFVHFDSNEISSEYLRRVSKYHLFPTKNKNLFKRLFDRVTLTLQFNVDRVSKSNIVFQKGANWFTITNDLAKYIVSQEEKIKRIFKHTLCADEMFLQTIVINSPYRDNISKNNFCDNYDCINYCVDWKRGNPYEYTIDDYDFLVDSNMLFARKFNWNKDKDIILKLYTHVKGCYNE